LDRIRFAALAAALAAALPAGATQKLPPTSTARPAAAARPTTPPAAAPLAPVAPGAPATSAASVARVAWIGGGVGAVSAFDVGKGVALHLDYGLLRTPRGWRKLTLEYHLAATFAMPAGETPLTATVAPPLGGPPVSVDAGEEKVSALLFEVVPTARVLWALRPGFALFADGGLGLCQTVERYERAEMFQGKRERTDYVTGGVARLGLGLAADVSERWRVVFEPVAFSFQAGPKFSAFTPTLGVAYRL
jgi:hypothetical protein